MRCEICRKTKEETELYQGILDDKLVWVCAFCAENEGMPLIRKPTSDQLTRADERHSVRERMERLSGMRETTEISQDQVTVQKNLARLKSPEKKDFNEEVIDNYFWNLKMARRRLKMTESQLASKIGVNSSVIHSIERGKLPVNYKEIFLRIEAVVGVKMLKEHDIGEAKTKEDEERILSNVRLRMEGKEPEDEDYYEVQKHREKKEKLLKIAKGEADISKRMDLSNVTINDLVEIKKSKEKAQERRNKREYENTMLGDDLNLDLDEV